ncbi:MAG: hypothetical protein BMS9Abin29_0105 [Gemmatimonadota bacterium]|nr:MAG: hypothetical protein BMS9Abin29_0105 [Gemmatimonadota bacterium]
MVTCLAGEGVGMAEASGAFKAERSGAARTNARNAEYGVLLRPAAAGDRGAYAEGRQAPRRVRRD